MTVTDLYYDPYDYTIDADPYPVWKRLRDESPVYWNERHGFYALSRYDDVLNGLLDIDTFRSGHGIVLEMIGDEPYENIPMMIMKDPPEHTRLRKLVSRAFTPRRIADLERRIAKLCDDLFETVDGQDEFDYIGAFAGLLPPTVILALVGFPDGYAAEFRERADSSLHIEDGDTMLRHGIDRSLVSENGEIANEVFGILPELMEQRRADPQDDLISGLVHAEIDEDGETRTLTLEEIVGFVQLISSAGTETVARLLGFAAVTLAKYPDQRQLLIDDPSLVPNAIEELLRYEAPSPIQSRWVSCDVELHGTVIPRGLAARTPQRFRRPRRAALRGSRPLRRAAGDRPAPRVRLRHPLLRRGRARTPRGHGRVGRDAATVPDLGDRREPARPRAHEHRARLHRGADASALTALGGAKDWIEGSRPNRRDRCHGASGDHHC